MNCEKMNKMGDNERSGNYLYFFLNNIFNFVNSVLNSAIHTYKSYYVLVEYGWRRIWFQLRRKKKLYDKEALLDLHLKSLFEK